MSKPDEKKKAMSQELDNDPGKEWQDCGPPFPTIPPEPDPPSGGGGSP